MQPLALVITNAGLSAFTQAQLGGDIDLTIAEVGFTDAAFALAPTLTALPGEFKRLATVSGEATAPDTIHMVVRDASPTTYAVRGFGLFLTDGTLFAVYGQDDVLLEKSSSAIALLALDLRFPPEQVAEITFGDTNFLNPLATETVAGVARVATDNDVQAGTEDGEMITPKKLKRFIPVGAIMLWFGTAAAVPYGWAICDGSQVQLSDGSGPIATPDLRNRVAVGAGPARQVGEMFGAASRTVNTTAAGAHGHTGTAPAHAHQVELDTSTVAAGVTVNAPVSNQTAGGGSGASVTSVQLNDAGHKHHLSGQTNASAVLQLTIAQAPDHQHEATIDVTQPSIALHYIMRI